MTALEDVNVEHKEDLVVPFLSWSFGISSARLYPAWVKSLYYVTLKNMSFQNQFSNKLIWIYFRFYLNMNIDYAL